MATPCPGPSALEHRVAVLPDKLNALPLDNVANSADDTLKEVERTVASLNAILQDPDLRALPASLEATLAELDRTLRKAGSLAGTLEEQPSSLVFSREPVADPIPPARSP